MLVGRIERKIKTKQKEEKYENIANLPNIYS